MWHSVWDREEGLGKQGYFVLFQVWLYEGTDMDWSIVSVLPTIDDDQPAPSLEKTTGVTAQEQITVRLLMLEKAAAKHLLATNRKPNINLRIRNI